MTATQDRKYFGTDGIRGCVGESLINPMFVMKLGWAAGKVLGARSKNGKKVLIGKDTRISGYMLEAALEAGLCAAGMEIYFLGPMPTPAIAYLTRTQRACAGIVISASHNLYQDNGLKFFSRDGFKLNDEIELEIEKQLELPMETVPSIELGRAKRIKDAPGRYIEFCKSTVPSHVCFKGLKVVLDCANGATYQVAPSVFRELGASVVEICTSPNGLNINDRCGSTHIETLQKAVLAEAADIGVAFDGDGDRLLMVDRKGEVIDGDEILYIMARHQQATKQLQGGVVGTTMSNLGFEKAIKQLGLDFVRTPVGDRHVLAALHQRNWTLGGESSGHIVNLNHTTTGDGIISALQILRAVVESEQDLHTLKQGMNKFPQLLLNVKIQQSIDIKDQTIQQAITSAEQQLGNDGRVVIRLSGTEPLVRIMVEGEQETEVASIAQRLVSTVEQVSTK